MKFSILAFLSFVLVHASSGAPAPGDLADTWRKAEVTPLARPEALRAVRRFQQTQGRYETVEETRPNGVPAIVVFALHGRESGWDFRCHLHEGSPLTHRTKYVPKGRPAAGNPPFSWETSAEDALYILKSEQSVEWSNIGELLWAVEKYNGTGYRRYHPEVPTPYIWSKTTASKRGKYVEDGRFDRMAIDSQLGCAAIFKIYLEQGNRFPP